MTRRISRADIQHLHQLGQMKEKGILTAEEFADQKAVVLAPPLVHARLSGRSPAARLTLWATGAVAALILFGATFGVLTDRSTAGQMRSPAIASNR